MAVDANVIVKAFVAEPESEAAGRLWSSAALLAAPAHALGEVGEALRRKRKLNEITAEQWHEIALVLPGAVMAIGLDDIFEPAMRISLEPDPKGLLGE